MQFYLNMHCMYIANHKNPGQINAIRWCAELPTFCPSYVADNRPLTLMHCCYTLLPITHSLHVIYLSGSVNLSKSSVLLVRQLDCFSCEFPEWLANAKDYVVHNIVYNVNVFAAMTYCKVHSCLLDNLL